MKCIIKNPNTDWEDILLFSQIRMEEKLKIKTETRDKENEKQKESRKIKKWKRKNEGAKIGYGERRK